MKTPFRRARERLTEWRKKRATTKTIMSQLAVAQQKKVEAENAILSLVRNLGHTNSLNLDQALRYPLGENYTVTPETARMTEEQREQAHWDILVKTLKDISTPTIETVLQKFGELGQQLNAIKLLEDKMKQQRLKEVQHPTAHGFYHSGFPTERGITAQIRHCNRAITLLRTVLTMREK